MLSTSGYQARAAINMDEFLYKYGIPNINQDKINNLKWSITRSETESGVEISPNKIHKERQ